MAPYRKLPCPISNAGNSFGIGILQGQILEGIVLSMECRCVRDLRSQDQLVDSKMMVESKAVAFVTLLMVWQRIESF